MIVRAATTAFVLLLSLLISFDSHADKPASETDLIRVELETLVPDEQARAVILVLKPEEKAPAPGEKDEPKESRVLPMTIGFEEARSIYVAFQKMAVPRPLTHDLMKNIIEEYGGEIVSCAITKMERETFFAELRLKRAGREVVIDCRPSDAIALALRSGTPIYVKRAVLDRHSIDPTKPEEKKKAIKT
ncbi:MAG: bifunctional nuclease family protein [Blastocatellia bacterium]|nr:bifunctional nuclease family protein [Blastocatellia bacterium]